MSDAFHQTFSIGAFWGIPGNEHVKFWVHGHGGVHLAGICTVWPYDYYYLENYWTEFHQTFIIDAFWDKDECFYFWAQQVRSQDQSMVKGPAGGGIQSSMLSVEF